MMARYWFEYPSHRCPVARHYCGPTQFGSYMMGGDWIDTDNAVWAEPVHYYTAHQPAVLWPNA